MRIVVIVVLGQYYHSSVLAVNCNDEMKFNAQQWYTQDIV